MPVKDADPAARSLDDAFASAMGAPARPKDPPPPREVDPEAPHGRDEHGVPLEPHGRNKDGSIRKSAAGRPAKEDRARTAPPGSQPPAGNNKPAEGLCQPGEFAKELSDTADTIWFGMSALAKAAPGIPVIGPKLPAERIQAQAAVWWMTKDRAVAAVSLAAEHNAAAARFARKLQGGDITWMITCLSLVAPIVSLSATIWSKDADKQLADGGQPSLAELAVKNDAAMDDAIRQMTAQAEAAANEQAAALNGQAG